MSVFSLLGNPVIVTLLSSTENREGHTSREGHTLSTTTPRTLREKIRKFQKHKTREAVDNPRRSKSHLNGNKSWLKRLPCVSVQPAMAGPWMSVSSFPCIWRMRVQDDQCSSSDHSHCVFTPSAGQQCWECFFVNDYHWFGSKGKHLIRPRAKGMLIFFPPYA